MAKRTRPRPAPNPVDDGGARPSPASDRAGKATSAPSDDARATSGEPAGFWEGHELAWTKLVVVRLVFFGLMAIDAFTQLGHDARYGAGGFNVPQLTWLPLPGPSRAGMIAIHGFLALAFALIAQGVAVRALLPVATALYAYAYFVSQLDSYQHHYLMTLVLVAWCFVPRAPTPALVGAGPAAQRTVRSWALRLVLVQLGVLYLWAAIAKLDPAWLDGSALRGQVAKGWVRDAIATIGFGRVAAMVLVCEFALAATVWSRRTWWLALPVGVGLHVGIEFVGLEIGLFSYLMLALYLLVVPDRVYHGLDRATRSALARARAKHVPWLVGGGVTAALAVVAYLAVPLPLGLPLVAAVVVVAAVVGRALLDGDRGRAGLTLAALAVALWSSVVVASTTDTLIDHYRYWAGGARRLGDDETARRAYQGMLAVEPSSEYAHYYLGGLAAQAGAIDDALAHYHAAQRATPRRSRAFVAEARIVLSRGDRAAAAKLIEDALAIDPADAEARALERTLAAAPSAPSAPSAPPSGPSDGH